MKTALQELQELEREWREKSNEKKSRSDHAYKNGAFGDSAAYLGESASYRVCAVALAPLLKLLAEEQRTLEHRIKVLDGNRITEQIHRAEDAQEEQQAMVAAAYEQAAQHCDEVAHLPKDHPEKTECAKRIRALASSDERAAPDAEKGREG